MNNAYVTLLSSKEYLVPILALNLSFKNTNSAYPLVVMVTDNIADDKNLIKILEQEHIKYVIVPTLSYSRATLTLINKDYPNNNTVQNTASKINMFNLEEYDKLVYIDGDSVFFQNCDQLFNFPDGSMLYDGKVGLTGLLVFIPENHDFNFYMACLNNVRCLDGNLIDTLWFQIKTEQMYRIPMNYCYLSSENDKVLKYVKSITFNEHKLWKDSITELLNSNNQIYNIYGKYLLELKNKYHFQEIKD